MYAPKLKLLP